MHGACPIVVLLLVHSSFNQRQNSYQKCSKELLESFRKKQDPREYHLTIEGSLSNVGITVKEHFVEYQGE